MKSKILLAGFILLVFWSCASAPVPRQIINAFQIDKPYDLVWTAIIETFTDLQLPIMNVEKDSGLIVTDWIELIGQNNQGYCDCGGLGINIEENRMGKFNVFVKKTSESSCEIKINTAYQQTYSFGKDIYRRNCISTGKLEKEFYDSIATKTSK